MSIILGTLERLETQSVSGQASLAQSQRSDRAGRFLTAMFAGLAVLVAISAYAGWRYLQAAVGHVPIPAVAFLDAGADAGQSGGDTGRSFELDAYPATREQAPDSPPIDPLAVVSTGNVAESAGNTPSAEQGDGPLQAAAQAVELVENVQREASVVSVEVVAQEPVEAPVANAKSSDTAVVAGFAQVGEAPAAAGQAGAYGEPATAVAPTVNEASGVLHQQADPVDRVVDEARNALSLGNYADALAALESVPDVSEHRADYWLVKGSAHLALGMLEAAENSLGKADSVATGNPQVAVQLAIVKQEKDDHPAALRILSDAAADNAHVPEIFLNMGYSQLALGDQPEAQRSFRTFMKLTQNRSRYQQQREALQRWLQQASVATR